MLAAGHVAVMLQEPCNDILFSRAKVYSGDSWACVTIVGDHTNIVRIETDKGVVFTQADNAQEEEKPRHWECCLIPRWKRSWRL